MVSEEDVKILEEMQEEIKHELSLNLLTQKDIDTLKRRFLAIEKLLERNKELEHYLAGEINKLINDEKVNIYMNYIPKSLVEKQLDITMNERAMLGYKTFIKREDMIREDSILLGKEEAYKELLKGGK